MTLYIIGIVLIFVFLLVLIIMDVQNHSFSLKNDLPFAVLGFGVCSIMFTLIFVFYSTIMDILIYETKNSYETIQPKDGVYSSKLNSENYLVNIYGKDTLVSYIELNDSIQIPRIRIKTEYRKPHWYYFNILGEINKTHYLQFPTFIREIKSEKTIDIN